SAGPQYTDLKLPLISAPQSSVTASESHTPQLLGVVVFTDGRHNWGESPLALAAELGKRNVPIYPVLVAPEASPPDIAVRSARPRTTTVFKGSIVPVEVEIRVSGWPSGPVVVNLELPDEGATSKKRVTETIDHGGLDAVYRLTLRAELNEPGPKSLKV